jgi:hypothetical protein
MGEQMKTTMRVGDLVRNKASGHVGKVRLAQVPGMRDCALVEFKPGSDGYCIPRSQLEIVNRNGETKCKMPMMNC